MDLAAINQPYSFWLVALCAWPPVLVYIGIQWWMTGRFQKKMDGVLGSMHERFEFIYRKFDEIDGTLDKMDGTLDRIDGALDRMDASLDRIDGCLDQNEPAEASTPEEPSVWRAKPGLNTRN